MMTMGKKRFAACFLLFLLLTCGVTAVYGRETDGAEAPVSMEIASVYGNSGKMGVHVPVTAKLYGQSETVFSGTVEIATLENDPDNKDEFFQYIYPVEVGTAETKEYTFYVPLGQKSSRIYVTLKDLDGKTVLQRSMQFETANNVGRLLLGTLMDSELLYLDGVSLEYGMTSTKAFSFDETSLPEDARGLELLDVLAVNDFDTAKLSEKQAEAVVKWVENGGVLLIGTGKEADWTLAAFQTSFGIFRDGNGDREKINLGMEFTEKTPFDSEIEIYCAGLSAADGRIAEEDDGVELRLDTEYKKGRVCVYTYDLRELSEFIAKNPTYAAKMLSDILGEERISNIYYYSSYGSDQEYWNAYSMVNDGNADRLPNLAAYAVVLVVYIAVVGPGLYLFLKKRDMSRFYGSGVVLFSVVISVVIYLLGAGTRFTSQFLTTATLIDMNGRTAEETSYINVRTPDSRPLSMTISSEYTVTPLTKSNRYSEEPVHDFEDRGKGDFELRYGETETMISAGKSAAFQPRFFRAEKTTELSETISGTVSLMDGKVSGTIQNGRKTGLKNAVLLLYGQVYQIGDIAAGETVMLDEGTMLIWPVGMSYIASEWLAGENGNSSLYNLYLDKNFTNYTSSAYLLAEGEADGIMTEESIQDQVTDSMVLYAAKLNVNSKTGSQVYRSGLMNKPEVNTGSGSVYGDGLTMYGSDPVAVEYFLGTDIEVEKIALLPVSEEFLEDSDYYYLKLFDGRIYFYNHVTKEYDRIDMSKNVFTAEELSMYLTEKNSIAVKYTAGDTESVGVSSLLPHLMVTGRER